MTALIERWLDGDVTALERACGEQPELAGELRSRVAKLARLGLLPEPDASDDRGKQLGDFRLLAPLGGGGMGRVFLARQESLGRVVALKLLRQDLAPTVAARERFRREAAAVAALSHPSIVPVYSFGEEEGVSFLAMEFVAGCSLAEALIGLRGRDVTTLSGVDLAAFAGCEGRPGFTGGYAEACIHVTRQIAAALEHAHARGVLHRDVKPSNVMLDASGRALLVDFGLARAAQDASITAEHAVLGSLSWLPPERLSRDADEDARGDVYGLGATFYNLLALRPPYEARDIARLTSKIVAEDCEPVRNLNPRISRDAALVCETAIESDPSRRYATASEFLRDLDAVLGFGAITARRAGPLRSLRRYVRRNPWRAAAAVLAFLLACVTPTLLWRQASRSRERLNRAFEETTQALQQAQRERDAKQRALDALQLAADRKDHLRLSTEADALWPVEVTRVTGPGGMDEWLAEANALRLRLSQHAVDSEAKASLSALDATIDRIERRRACAIDLARRSIEDPAAARAWAASAARVEASPFYRRLRLTPQLGLLPLGPDPRSAFEEFAVLATGAPSERGADGALTLGEDSAGVLVLLPGGEFTMGAWSAGRAPPDQDDRVDPYAEDDESPPHTVTLAPFFLGKHEMTQAQWQRLAEENPAAYRAGASYSTQRIDARHPVESITHREAVEILARAALALPTEAQWEYGARAGTATSWWCGGDPRSLAGVANLADRSLAGSGTSLPVEEWLEDGFIVHAPVGSLRANPFGLHDVVGNVRELCADRYGPYSNPPRQGDALRSPADSVLFVVRDAAFMNRASGATASQRSSTAEDSRVPGIGVRAARPLRP